MKKILLLLALVSMIFAGSAFQASMEPVEREASPDNQAVFNVNVFNNHSEERRFTLDYEFSRQSWIYFETSKTIPAGESRDFRVTFNTGEDALEGSYSFKIFVRDFQSRDTIVLSDYMRVNREYSMNVQQHSFSSEKVDPGDTAKASVTVQNILPRIVDDYSISSSFDSQTKQADVEPLAPGSVKTYNFEYDISEEASPETKNLTLEVNQGEETRFYSQHVTVNEMVKIDRSQSVEDKVLTVSGTREIINNGNSPQELSENISFSSYIEPVLNLNPEPNRTVEGDENKYIWDFVLEPGEKIVISYSINYWVPLVLAMIIVVGIAILGRLTGSVKVTKETEETEKGLKVSLKVINNSQNYRPEITVRDFVPNVAELHEDFDMAEPEVRKTTDGTKIEWNLEDFKPGEERVIQYKVESKVEVEDGLDLPDPTIVNDRKTDQLD